MIQVVSHINADSERACLPIHHLQEEEVRKVLKKSYPQYAVLLG